MMNFIRTVLLIVGSLMLVLDLNKLNCIEENSNSVKMNIEFMKNKHHEIQDFKTRTARLPTPEELNCGMKTMYEECDKEIYFTTLKLKENKSSKFDYIIEKTFLGVPFSGVCSSGTKTFKYDPETGKSNYDYRNTYWKSMGLYITKIGFDILLMLPFLVNIFRKQKLKKQ